MLLTVGIINGFVLSNLDIYLYANSAHPGTIRLLIYIYQYIFIVGRYFTANIPLFICVIIRCHRNHLPFLLFIRLFNIRVISSYNSNWLNRFFLMSPIMSTIVPM